MVHSISQLNDSPESREYLAKVLTFLSCMPQSFKVLLRRKDPRTLLLLMLWYQKAGRAVWWIDMRSRIERQAICLYLRRYHSDNADIQELLPYE